jgi:hypothetical protein
MKKVIFIISIILPLVFSSCISSRSYLNRGYYDMAIQKSSKKLMKNPNKSKQFAVLHKSFNVANQKDLERITFLKNSGQPDIWEEMFELYSRMNRRQNMVKYLSTDLLSKMNFQNVNYDNEIHSAKLNAAEFFYASGLKFLNENTRNSARLAYHEFLKVRKYFQNFRDTDKLIREAEDKGTVNILFQAKNATGLIMPQGFAWELTQLPLSDMNILFRRFFNVEHQDIQFHYDVTLFIQDIIVSPEQIREVHYTETKELQDGFQFVYDQNGNVMKDSLGNDIRVPKYITVSCNIAEISQFKSVAVGAVISIVNERNQLLINEPLSGEWVFDNRYVMINGDQRALSDATKAKLSWRPLPFPATEFMILQTTDVLKKMSKDFVYRHRNIFL